GNGSAGGHVALINYGSQGVTVNGALNADGANTGGKIQLVTFGDLTLNNLSANGSVKGGDIHVMSEGTLTFLNITASSAAGAGGSVIMAANTANVPGTGY